MIRSQYPKKYAQSFPNQEFIKKIKLNNQQCMDCIKNGKGVYLGKRTVGNRVQVQLNSTLINHHVVAVNGEIWHLQSHKDKKLFSGTYTIEKCKDSLNSFDWHYIGQAKNNPAILAQVINHCTNYYDILLQNCQHIALAIYKYATGTYSLKMALKYLGKAQFLNHFKEKKQQIKEETLNSLKQIRCPNDHKLIFKKAIETSMWCDLCDKALRQQKNYACNICNFNICMRCYNK